MVVTSYLLPEGGTEQTITAPESSGNAFSVPEYETTNSSVIV
jgi:hypothetical protein